MSEQNKIALITGANKGIGLETARQLGQLGFHVFLGSRDASRGQHAVDALRTEGIQAELLVLDQSSPESIAQAAETLHQKVSRLDVLVNNAGIQIEDPTGDWQASTAGSIPMPTLRETFEVNFFGLIDLTQRLLPLLKAAPAARIVNLSSILGSLTLHSDPESPIYGTKLLGYNASKTALNAFTIHLAYELRDTKILVNSAHPGWVATDMGGSQAPMSVAEGAKTSVILATLPEGGPTGGYFHLEDSLPW